MTKQIFGHAEVCLSFQVEREKEVNEVMERARETKKVEILKTEIERQ